MPGRWSGGQRLPGSVGWVPCTTGGRRAGRWTGGGGVRCLRASPAPRRPRCSLGCVHEHAPPLRWAPSLRFRRVCGRTTAGGCATALPRCSYGRRRSHLFVGRGRGRSARPQARSGRRQGPLPAGEVCTAQKRVGGAVVGVFVPGGAEPAACKQGVAVRAYPLPPLIGARSRLGGCLAVADNGAEAGAGRA